MLSLVVTGFPRHAPDLAALLNAYTGAHARSYSDDRMHVLRAAFHALTADAAITVGGPQPNEIVRTICNARGRPVILIWAGSDVQTIKNDPAQLERLRLANVVHWACAKHLVTELSVLGIQARYVPLASATVPEHLAPLPSMFTVLTYLPEPRRAFYGQEHVWEAARVLSDAAFVVVGPGKPERDAPPNVRYLGPVGNMNAAFDAASVFLRIPEHDGLARTVVEALARGRHAIWTYPFPGALCARQLPEVIDALRMLRQAHREGRLGLNHPGVEYVAAEHDPAALARGIVTAVHDAIEETRSKGDDRSRLQLAVSGQEMLSARVIQNARSSSVPISATMLGTHNHSETAMSLFKLAAGDRWYAIGEPVGPKAFEIAASLTRKRRILHWLGDEIEILRENSALLRKFKTDRFVHLAQTDAVREQLHEFGLQSRLAPVAAVTPAATIPPLPGVFTLLLYVSRRDPQFYGRYQYERLMHALSGERVRYMLVGGGRIDVPPGVDAERLDWSGDLSSIYERSTALIRLTPCHSASSMVVEALLRGRHVLCANEFPFTVNVRNFQDLEHAVRSLLERHYSSTLAPQFDAAREMMARYSPQLCLSLLAGACGVQPPASPAAAVVRET